MKKGLVSIVIPVYNASEFIKDTINSIKNQTYQNYELILVDDCSKDDSVKIIEENKNEQIHLIKNLKNKGSAESRNVGIKEAKGEFICFLDADDIWNNQKLEKQISFMKEKKCAFSFTGYEFLKYDLEPTSKIVHVPSNINYSQALKNTTIFTSTVMFNLNYIKKEQIYFSNVKSEDTATWWRILKQGYIGYGIDEVLSYYRRSKHTLSSNKIEALRRIWNLYRNVEHLNIFKSSYCFLLYAYHAVKRRI